MVAAAVPTSRHPAGSAKAWLPAAVGLVGAAVLVALWRDRSAGHVAWVPQCPFKLLTGWDCPGCGSTHMVQALLRGDLRAAARANVAALAATPFLLYSYAAWTLRTYTRWRPWRWRPRAAHVNALLVAVVAWTVVRDLPIGPFRDLRS